MDVSSELLRMVPQKKFVSLIQNGLTALHQAKTFLRVLLVKQHMFGRKAETEPIKLGHPTIGGLAFDAKGRRFAVAHYGGVTIWEKHKSR